MLTHDMDPHTPTKRNFNSEMDQTDDECVTPKKCLKINDTTKKGTKQKNKRLQKYKSQWENEHGDWLINDPQNEYNGKCKLCGTTFTIASAGIGQVRLFYFICVCASVCVFVWYWYGCIKYPS